eukprot:2487639-Pleurochrysis_carterae.AAC.1
MVAAARRDFCRRNVDHRARVQTVGLCTTMLTVDAQSYSAASSAMILVSAAAIITIILNAIIMIIMIIILIIIITTTILIKTEARVAFRRGADVGSGDRALEVARK